RIGTGRGVAHRGGAADTTEGKRHRAAIEGSEKAKGKEGAHRNENESEKESCTRTCHSFSRPLSRGIFRRSRASHAVDTRRCTGILARPGHLSIAEHTQLGSFSRTRGRCSVRAVCRPRGAPA